MDKIIVCAIALLALSQSALSAPIDPTDRYPLMIIPGAGGSRLLAKWDKAKGASATHCDRKQSQWFQLWPTPQVALPFAVECWVDNIKLNYDERTGTTSNTPGVEVTFPGFGQTDKLEYLTDVKVDASKYFKDMVDASKKWGYVPGKNIRSAPYDFRKSPHEQDTYFENLKSLIENTYLTNNNKPVVMIAHSLGGLYTLYFLQNQRQDWKDKYVKAMVSIGAPYLGALTAIQGYASGYNLNLVILPADKLRTVQRTWLSMAAMLPSEKYWPNTPYITTPTRNYTTKDYPQYFNDIGFAQGYQMYQKMKDKLRPDVPPNVEVHCLVGTALNTPITFEYKKSDKFPEGKTKETYIDGDATVPTLSQSFCKTWEGKQKQKVEYREFPKVKHLQLVQSVDVLAYIQAIATGDSIPVRKLSDTQSGNPGTKDPKKKGSAVRNSASLFIITSVIASFLLC